MSVRSLVLIGAVLVAYGYSRGRSRTAARRRDARRRDAGPASARPAAACPAERRPAERRPAGAGADPARSASDRARREILSVKLLLCVVIVLLLIAILSSLQR